MKKIILYTIIALLPTSFFNAQILQKGAKINTQKVEDARTGSIRLGYCTDDLNTVSFGGSVAAKFAIKLPKEYLAAFVGNQITKINIGTADAVTNASVFLATNLSTPFYTQSGVSLSANMWNSVTLTTPYTIEASKDIYIGYSATLPNFSVDGEMTENSNGDLISCSAVFGNQNWYNLKDAGVDSYISLNVTVEGTTLPQLNLSITPSLNLILNNLVLVKTSNTDFDIKGKIKNNGNIEINSFDIKYKIGNATEQTQTVSGISLPNNTTYSFNLSVSTQEEGELPVIITIDNLNGNQIDEYDPDNTLNFTLISSSNLFVRKFVEEEATSSACGYCPRGIVGMSYMKSTYPERFIGIAVHGNMSWVDPMLLSSYINALGVPGFPSALFNRQIMDDPASDVSDYYYNNINSLSAYSVSSVASYQDDTKTKVNISTIINSALSVSINASIAYVITEDDVHSTSTTYRQSNYYSGGGYGPMGGYENLPNPVPAAQMYYQEVARGIFPSFTGAAGSVPAQLYSNDPATFYYTLTLPTTILDKNNISLITLLLDNETGVILNADKTEIGAPSAIDNINTVNINAFVANNILIIDTDKKIGNVEIFNIAGQKVLSTNATNNIALNNLSSGIYLAKINIEGKDYMQKISVH